MCKRIWALVVSIGVLLACLPIMGLSVAAAAQGTLTTVADGLSVESGEELTFTVQMDSCGTEMNAFAILMGSAFDNELFEFVSAQWLIEGLIQDVDVEKLNAVIAFGEPTAINGAVLSFTLRAKDILAVDTETAVSAAVQAEEDILFTCDGAKVTVTVPVEEALSTETKAGITFRVYESAGNTHKLVISGNGSVPVWTNLKAYAYASTITDVVIEEGITAIDKVVFQNNTALKSVTFPSTLTAIGNKAFLGSGLVSVSVPDGILLGEAVFMNCKSLTSAHIGNVKMIEEATGKERLWIPKQTFSGCSALKTVTFGDKLNAIGNAAFAKAGIETLTIPGNIRSVGNVAFNTCTSLTTVVLEDGVRTLAYQAFAACTKLTDVTIPASVTGIGAGVFRSCYGLKEITLPNSITELKADLFFDNRVLNTVNLPETVTKIDNRAFYKCVKLENVVIPETVTSIGKHAFYNCRALTEITIPESVTTITEEAFNYCKALETVTIHSAKVAAGITSEKAMGELVRYAKTVYIRSDITTVGAYITNTYTRAADTVTVDGVEYVVYTK